MTKRIANLLLLILVFGFQILLIAAEPNFRSVSRARTLSLNSMYIAGCDGTNSLFNNAAALAYFNSKAVELSLVDVIGQSQFNNSVNDLYNSYQQDEVPLSASIIFPVSSELVVSLSYQRVYSYDVDWPFAVLSSTDSSSYLQTFDLYNNYNVDAILAGVAYKFGKISFGATFDAFNVSYESAFPLSNSSWGDTLGLPVYQMQYDMNAWSFGFNVGLMIELLEDLRFGAFARSSFSSDLEGNANSEYFSSIDSTTSSTSVTTNYQYPWVAGAGVLYKVSTNFILNLDFQYSFFGSSSQNIDMNFANQIWEEKNFGIDPLMGIDPSNIQLSFENAIDAGIGVEYLSKDWSFRGGYRFSQSQNTLMSFNYLYPTVDQNWVSLGFGYTDSIYFLDFSVAYAFGVNTYVNTYPNVSGNYDSETVDVSVTLKYVF